MTALAACPDRDRVLLISLPWAELQEPNLGLGILKTVLQSHGIGCDVLEAPMRMLKYVKYDTYKWISQFWGACDFVFTREFEEISDEQRAVLPKMVQDWQECLPSISMLTADPEQEVAKLMRLREEIVPRYLDDLMSEIDFSRYAFVGFTCLFDQTIASLAMAHRIKRLHPDLMVAFGGYALNRPVGPALQKAFREMDVVAYGDGEPVIVPLYEAAMGRRDLADVPNITYRDGDGRVVASRTTERIELDDSPAPDYDDFFLQREQMRQKHKVAIQISEMPVESSRGCWYGAKNHCTFCGIDDETLRYRFKSGHVTIAQLDQLHERYNAKVFRFADYIMPMRNYKEFLPEMVRRGAPYSLHYETKANLKESQLELCAAAGIRFLQPGIESFSSPVLKLMDKGVTGAQNIYTLYTMFRYKIQIYYNIIFGFPFEEPDHYSSMIKLMPALYHLPPPGSMIPVQVVRYAPLAEDLKRFGAEGKNLKAHWRYDSVFSQKFLAETGFSMDDVCYFFENPYRNYSAKLRMLHDLLQHQSLKWNERSEAGAKLTFRYDADEIVISDTRYVDEPEVHRFPKICGVLGEVLRPQLCNEARLLEEMAARGYDAEAVRPALAALIEARVVISENGQYVWLAFDEKCVDELIANVHIMRDTIWGDNEEYRHPSEWPPREDIHSRSAPLGLEVVEIGAESVSRR